MSQIRVHGHDMHTLTSQSVEIDGQNRGQRLAFPGFHFRNIALMQKNAADQLDGIRTFADHPFRRLASRGKGFRKQIIEALALT